MKFRITDCKGFYFGFENGWGVSVQFGPGNYADNYDMRIGSEDRDAGRRGSDTAECAVIAPDNTLFAHPDFDGDTVKGHCTPNEVFALLAWAQVQAPNVAVSGTAKRSFDGSA